MRWIFPWRKKLKCSQNGHSKLGTTRKIKERDQGAKYLFFVSSRSVKTREVSFAQFVYFLRKVCLFFNFWLIKSNCKVPNRLYIGKKPSLGICIPCLSASHPFWCDVPTLKLSWNLIVWLAKKSYTAFSTFYLKEEILGNEWQVK